MLCYLARMGPYYLKCIKDGPFQSKTAEDDIMESVISCETAQATWTHLVHSFEGPSDTKENKIMDLKLEYQTFRPLKASHRPTPAIRPCLMSLLKMGFRNANHTQTLDLADIYGRFVYEDNLIQRRISKKNSNDEVDGRSNYKAEYKKMKAKLTLLEANPSTSQTPKTFQPKNKGLVAETFDWDEEEVSDDEEVTQVKVLMALADDELTIRKNHARNGEWLTSL
ncbi:hypothetical protein Tco_0926475 [Tanacetum coccineum]|uniref:Uncharacterized protein n=1 Tax=Tanacetum coccineum TaxID=301880 RepID=A0ABQ5D9W4_9ASTR